MQYALLATFSMQNWTECGLEYLRRLTRAGHVLEILAGTPSWPPERRTIGALRRVETSPWEGFFLLHSFTMAQFGRYRFLIVAVVFHLIYIYSIFSIYFVSPVVHGMREHRIETQEAPAKRLVLFVGTCESYSDSFIL